MKKTQMVGIAILGMLAGCQGQTSDTMGENKNKEKCYGISKKGMNACGNSWHGCGGKSIKDGAKDEWIYLSSGVCSKIVGGSLKEGASSKPKG